MFRILRVPPSLDKFFRPLRGAFHWDHFTYFRLLVRTIAFMWGRRNVANLYRYLDAAHHRTRFNNFFLVKRWDPEAALHQKARELLRALHPQGGETLYLILDDSKTAKRGLMMDAVAKLKDPTTEAYIRGHHDVCAILVCREQVIPWGIRLYAKKEHCARLKFPFRKTTELAAQLIREFQAPAGVKVLVLFDAYYLCHTVVKACRAQHFHFASTLKSHRSLFKPGWKLKAGRYGKNVFRRRRTTPFVLTNPHGSLRYRYVDVGWLQVSKRGLLHVVFSRKGAARKILGLVTDDPTMSAAGLIQAYDRRWDIEQWIKDAKQLLGLGQYQNRSDGAAVTHLHLVCFAYALLTHLRIERTGAQGQRRREKATGMSVATAQEPLRGLIWDDLVIYLKEQGHEKSVLAELERLRVA
ncbi:MAG TPA: transposase [Alphaproteobacteria bacterium]|nr:transposase [Alphaproteobacteria bacterium]